ncbi:endonuclease/exonuclease/phosphatase family protein [Zobellia galactanivorans]|uniref:endonuclease/exonuclease/phosphatase family protein n=1 Tax=Zobellia galactanivorans (strain DSM 12802 / CCUG 47099 / CIP 106680 / NCIMB 13871 / Dsij) TaxID=63186 RepID=UPI0026E34068|nr:endonuclease/exonuclease/phosphatase family protein [Zobellia galactanivorans]MDO6807844.1 endonuclease/exonuclease/phosphatase family protein [Zobellia galactanivorans]
MALRTIFFSFLFLALYTVQAQDLKVMSYNIKFDNVNDTVNNWNDRKTDMEKLLKHYAPEFIGMQEVLYRQLTYLDGALEDYNSIGVGRDDGKKKGEFSPILYNSKKFKLIRSNTFWLSPTPDKISVGWDAAMERICTYGLFENKANKQRFWVFNTHFDHIGTEARERSAALIVKKIKEINTDKIPVVLTGDFNLEPDTKPIQFLKKEMTDGQEASLQPLYGPTGTFSGFDHKRILDRRIDYIFIEGLTVLSYIHIDDRMENNKHISDHLPILATLKK